MLAELARPGALLLIALVPLCTGASGAAAQNRSSVAPEVQQHLEEIIRIARQHSIHRRRIDWSAYRLEVFKAAQGAQNLRQAEAAVLRALELLADGHSFYQAANPWSVPSPREWFGASRGYMIRPLLGDSSARLFPFAGERARRLPPPARLYPFAPCPHPQANSPAIPPGIGYVQIRGSEGGSVELAEAIQQQIRRADREQLRGWIVDLRGNTGGNMWPMLLGIGPILGEGLAGFFVDPDGSRSSWGYKAGAVGLNGDSVLALNPPYALKREATRVAVLMDGATVSSGEVMVVAFRGRNGTRLFGQPTCGRSTANRPFRLSNGATLFLTVSHLADRTGRVYEGRLEPDELTEGKETVRRAIEWLLSR